MRVLLDTDVILDVVLAREPFASVSVQLFKLHDEGVIEGCVAAVTPVNVFYFVRKFRDIAVARQAVDLLLDSFTVCPLTAAVLRAAHALPISDYEDAVQHASGTAVGVEAIVTRNVDDYKNATVPIFTPTDFLQHLNSGQET